MIWEIIVNNAYWLLCTLLHCMTQAAALFCIESPAGCVRTALWEERFVCWLLSREYFPDAISRHHFLLLACRYKNNLYRVKIPLLTKLGKSDQQKQEIERTQNMRRRHQIDAAIVRIMKTRKTLNVRVYFCSMRCVW